MHTENFFTVIIPSKNRAAYLYYTLKTCYNQDYNNLEIYVSDDGSTDNTKEVVDNATKIDSRIKYITPGSSVGMLENFEFALNHVKPGFVIALGGDDGLMPNAISKMNEIINKTGLELLAWPSSIYIYPDTKDSNGQLILNIKNGKPLSGLKILKSSDFLNRQSKNLFYVSDIESPMVYVKGVVSTNLINKVKSRTNNNKFYSCSTPDGYSGIVLAGEVEKYAFFGEPLTIFGVSPTSQGKGYLSNNNDMKKQSEEFFKNVVNIPMHKELCYQPYSPLISLMTADFLLTARDLPGWKGKFDDINFKSLINKALNELKDGLFSEDRIDRELEIIKNIAIQHGLEKYYLSKLKKTKRNKRSPLVGNAISPRLLYLDAKSLELFNIFDASYFSYSLHKSSSNLSIKLLVNMLFNSINYKIKSIRKSKPLYKTLCK